MSRASAWSVLLCRSSKSAVLTAPLTVVVGLKFSRIEPNDPSMAFELAQISAPRQMDALSRSPPIPKFAADISVPNHSHSLMIWASQCHQPKMAA